LLLSRRLGPVATFFFTLASVVVTSSSAATLKVSGSTTVNPVVVDAAEILRRESDLEIIIDTLGGSSGGIAALADGRAHVGMSSRPLTGRDRERFPDADFRATPIGYDALALVVSKDVWDAGVRSLSAREMRAIYEGEIKNWNSLGGPDRRIAFFNKEPGRGTWEVFAHWLYGDAEEAPLVAFLEVGSNEEARQKIAGTRGALTQLSAAWADGESVFALSIETDRGELVDATGLNAAKGAYPISRPLLLVTNGPATAEATELFGLILGDRGRGILERHGYTPLAEFDAGKHQVGKLQAGELQGEAGR